MSSTFKTRARKGTSTSQFKFRTVFPSSSMDPSKFTATMLARASYPQNSRCQVYCDWLVPCSFPERIFYDFQTAPHPSCIWLDTAYAQCGSWMVTPPSPPPFWNIENLMSAAPFAACWAFELLMQRDVETCIGICYEMRGCKLCLQAPSCSTQRCWWHCGHYQPIKLGLLYSDATSVGALILISIRKPKLMCGRMPGFCHKKGSFIWQMFDVILARKMAYSQHCVTTIHYSHSESARLLFCALLVPLFLADLREGPEAAVQPDSPYLLPCEWPSQQQCQLWLADKGPVINPQVQVVGQRAIFGFHACGDLLMRLLPVLLCPPPWAIAQISNSVVTAERRVRHCCSICI